MQDCVKAVALVDPNHSIYGEDSYLLAVCWLDEQCGHFQRILTLKIPKFVKRFGCVCLSVGLVQHAHNSSSAGLTLGMVLVAVFGSFAAVVERSWGLR